MKDSSKTLFDTENGVRRSTIWRKRYRDKQVAKVYARLVSVIHVAWSNLVCM